MRLWTGSVLVVRYQATTWTMPAYQQLDSWEQISVKLESEFYHFHSRKVHFKMSSARMAAILFRGDELVHEDPDIQNSFALSPFGAIVYHFSTRWIEYFVYLILTHFNSIVTYPWCTMHWVLLNIHCRPQMGFPLLTCLHIHSFEGLMPLGLAFGSGRVPNNGSTVQHFQQGWPPPPLTTIPRCR